MPTPSHPAWIAVSGQLGDREFTVAELAALMRPHINPSMAIRRAEQRRRWQRERWRKEHLHLHPAPEEYMAVRRWGDDVEVGLRLIARSLLEQRCRSRKVIKVGRGKYRIAS